jgi:L-threonylcarbamoyladenylate synthase
MLNEIAHSLKILREGGTFIYPTDTVWGMGCDATDKRAVSKVFDIKRREESKSLIILVDGFEMLQRCVTEIPNVIYPFLETVSKPTTVIYKNPIGLASNVVAKDNTVAIRIVNNAFCKELIRQFDKPIVSTSANVSGRPTPKSFKEIDASLLDAVDYVVNLQKNKLNHSPSTIVKVDNLGQLLVIRE